MSILPTGDLKVLPPEYNTTPLIATGLVRLGGSYHSFTLKVLDGLVEEVHLGPAVEKAFAIESFKIRTYQDMIRVLDEAK